MSKIHNSFMSSLSLLTLFQLFGYTRQKTIIAKDRSSKQRSPFWEECFWMWIYCIEFWTIFLFFYALKLFVSSFLRYTFKEIKQKWILLTLYSYFILLKMYSFLLRNILKSTDKEFLHYKVLNILFLKDFCTR